MHAALQGEVTARGLLLAEMPTGTVAAETTPRSGSRITARLAGEAGLGVLAVQGSPPGSPSRRCNELIRDGALLVQSADDIAELLERFEGPEGKIASKTLREPIWSSPADP